MRQQLPDEWVDFKDDLSPKGAFIEVGPDRSLQWYCTDWKKAKDIESRLHCFFDFARERHAVYLRRAAGLPKPWTNDPILQTKKFCNIYRELDTVSQWVINEVIKPYEDDPNLWFMLCACRAINWPDTLAEMIDVRGGFGIRGQYSPDVAYSVMKSRGDRGLKTITGAYLVNSVTTPKDPDHIRGNKRAYLAYRTLGEIWSARKEVQGGFKSTLQLAVETLQKYKGYGPFVSYQVTVDLSYSNKWLGKAPDLNTFNSAGPGTARGLSRVFHGEKSVRMDNNEKTRLLAFQLKASGNQDYWPQTSKDMKIGFAPLSMSHVSNINCEADKHARLQLGEGKMRSSYPGQKETYSAQKSLF